MILRVMKPLKRSGFRQMYRTCPIGGTGRTPYYDYETHLRPMTWTFHGPVAA